MDEPEEAQESVEAGVLLIGDEILSGRTQDRNLAWLARALGEAGIQIAEARVIRDREAAIIAAVREFRDRFRYVFTTGGIGPTHDDITSRAVARAFSVALVRHPEADRLLRLHLGDRVNPERMRMADVPEGSELIANPVSVAPGFRKENVFVLAGVPSIMRAMMAGVLPQLHGGRVVHERTVVIPLPEGEIARGLSEIQQQVPAIGIGSYPFVHEGKPGASVVLRGQDIEQLEATTARVRQLAESFGAVPRDAIDPSGSPASGGNAQQ